MDNSTAGTVAPEQLTVNGQQFSVEDVNKFFALGQKYSELEGKLNTSLDKVVPEYTRSTQRAKELEGQLAERTRELEELQKPKAEVPQDALEARKAARGIGLVDEDYLKESEYIRKSDLDEYLNTRQTNQQLVDNVLKNADGLAKEIDGSDGRVPFVPKAVLAYASAYNVSDLKQAYDEMNEMPNAKWKDQQIAQAERPGLVTQAPGGVKEPAPVNVTEQNFKALWDELYPNK